MKNNFQNVRRSLCLFIFAALMALTPITASASPWAQKETYGEKVGGKFIFGLKHTLLSWMNPWAEAHDPKYETRWTGFCVGIGKAVVYTAAGAVQLVTFPIPVDFPDIGLGMHVPANQQKNRGKAKAETPGTVDTVTGLSTTSDKQAATAELEASNTQSLSASLPTKIDNTPPIAVK